ncbi:uncharacterized protein LOC112514639 [Cynara cardunculus var. scolymus]|uniref:Transcriptional coactivator Hfi1/Transcriptional adapter 1 n=1 Tax=Cynara cardunculus var. scolymus TaxID=59895 RepID=A0A118JYT4_CYNCS|nr:uncharacterized protein LOC112514639 [Cynara cardunculus var. scolymus]KVH99039.1 Transcriptional coactivator Hfi1/Transcriptional adapter 1 [Cynara cardunculus var. scolymus]
MQPPQQHSWNNLAEIKGQLIKKLGFERSKQYLDYLNRFLSLKLSKTEFDKLCLRTVGKDNIRLHNQLIRAVLKSACTGKLPIVIHDDSSRTVGNKKPSDGVYHQNGSIPVVTHVTSPLSLGNGDILPPSPRKARTGSRERRGGDRRSALGPNGKTNYGSLTSSIPQSADFSSLENGDSSSSDTRRAVHQQELIQEAENGGGSPDGFVGVHHKEKTESLGRKKDGKSVSDRISLHAPLGVPYCPVSIGGAYSAIPLAASSSSRCVGVLHSDGLLETTTLKDHMEQICGAQGLQGVSMDCANVVNSGLDGYLKGLIGSCMELNRARSVHELTKSGSIKNPTHSRPLNGVISHHQIQNSSWPLNAMQENEPKQLVTLLDFRVAMELNHKKLGEDWPILLEKICTHAFEE